MPHGWRRISRRSSATTSATAGTATARAVPNATITWPLPSTSIRSCMQRPWGRRTRSVPRVSARGQDVLPRTLFTSSIRAARPSRSGVRRPTVSPRWRSSPPSSLRRRRHCRGGSSRGSSTAICATSSPCRSSTPRDCSRSVTATPTSSCRSTITARARPTGRSKRSCSSPPPRITPILPRGNCPTRRSRRRAPWRTSVPSPKRPRPIPSCSAWGSAAATGCRTVPRNTPSLPTRHVSGSPPRAGTVPCRSRHRTVCSPSSTWTPFSCGGVTFPLQ